MWRGCIPSKALLKNAEIANILTKRSKEFGFSFENLEREIIMSSLKKANGNLSKAARLLQINRGKFRYRMEKLGIKSEDIEE